MPARSEKTARSGAGSQAPSTGMNAGALPPSNDWGDKKRVVPTVIGWDHPAINKISDAVEN